MPGVVPEFPSKHPRQTAVVLTAKRGRAVFWCASCATRSDSPLCPRVVHAAWALARLAGWQIPVWKSGKPDRPRTRAPAAEIRDAAEHAGADSAKRAVSLVARCFSLHGISVVFYEDRRPALLLYNGTDDAESGGALARDCNSERGDGDFHGSPLHAQAAPRACTHERCHCHQQVGSPSPRSSRPTSFGSSPLRASAFFPSTLTANPKPTPTFTASAHTATSSILPRITRDPRKAVDRVGTHINIQNIKHVRGRRGLGPKDLRAGQPATSTSPWRLVRAARTPHEVLRWLRAAAPSSVVGGHAAARCKGWEGGTLPSGLPGRGLGSSVFLRHFVTNPTRFFLLS